MRDVGLFDSHIDLLASSLAQGREGVIRQGSDGIAAELKLKGHRGVRTGQRFTKLQDAVVQLRRLHEEAVIVEYDCVESSLATSAYFVGYVGGRQSADSLPAR